MSEEAFIKTLSTFERSDLTWLLNEDYVSVFNIRGIDKFVAHKTFTMEGVEMTDGDQFYWNFDDLKVTRSVYCG